MPHPHLRSPTCRPRSAPRPCVHASPALLRSMLACIRPASAPRPCIHARTHALTRSHVLCCSPRNSMNELHATFFIPLPKRNFCFFIMTSISFLDSLHSIFIFYNTDASFFYFNFILSPIFFKLESF